MAEKSASHASSSTNLILINPAAIELRHEAPRTYRVGDVLQRAGEPVRTLYFPTSALVSFVRSLDDGSAVEVGVVGREGLIGVTSLFEASAQPNDITIQIGGDLVSVDLAEGKRQFAENPSFRGVVLRFANAFMNQVGQTAACNRTHALERRLARWLLMVDDRVPWSVFDITQEFLSQMLGTRIAGVNEAIASLSRSGLIRHGRQRVEIIDRAGLEASACECYEAVSALYALDSVLPRQ